MIVPATRSLSDATRPKPLTWVRATAELTSLAEADQCDGTGQERQRLTAQPAAGRPDVIWPWTRALVLHDATQRLTQRAIIVYQSGPPTSRLKALDALAVRDWMPAQRRMFEDTHDAITATRRLLHHTGVFPSVPRGELAHATRTTR